MARTALFVIDIQVELAQNAATEISHAERIRDGGTQILQSARQAIDSASEHERVPDLEIVFVQHEEVAEKGPLVKGSKAWKLVFKPRDDNRWERLVSKDVRDAFESNPQLAVELRNEGVETIVAFGIQSECCVLSTCRGALAAGFNVVLLQGAHSTYDIDGKTAGAIEGEVEAQLVTTGAEVVPWELWKPSASNMYSGQTVCKGARIYQVL
ncbi:Isochorismatase hydrolase [Ophiobolus disseminans]|uniref:Isochorismatase hydrolase n=1 Tax=Ophiobolus disseminans TaxID=1469910 RepID=A0A6A6ZM35_9PLEO|nr:Isochorismatase hydrolase [Ophiobolus disseminans]